MARYDNRKAIPGVGLRGAGLRTGASLDYLNRMGMANPLRGGYGGLGSKNRFITGKGLNVDVGAPGAGWKHYKNQGQLQPGRPNYKRTNIQGVPHRRSGYSGYPYSRIRGGNG